MTPIPPTPPTPRFTLPCLKLPARMWPVKWTALRQIGAVLATVALIAAFAGAFAILRGAGPRGQLASGPAATATATDTPTATPTPAPTATATPIPLHPNVVVTQNQDVRPACIDPTNAYTVVLANNGDVAANWHVDIPALVTLRPPSGPAVQPLFSPRSSSPYWAQAQPADGSVAPGQTASFVMAPDWAMPCGGTTYHAAVKLSFPSGASEPDIPLTYAGTGPAPYSQIDMLSPTSPTTSITLPCPAVFGDMPQSFIVAFKNSGNATAYPFIDVSKEHAGGGFGWADIPSTVENPPNEPVSSWLYPGETWTYTIQPHKYVLCDGTVYHVYLNFNLAQMTQLNITISVTFH
jgi:hypothetical protein